ncbi:MAG: TetR/AcrR family transcriptional regulator [Burkholderiales bacterium]|nr:TetR/AcrR family transcriptional regulator [Burkholderiales bacterium]
MATSRKAALSERPAAPAGRRPPGRTAPKARLSPAERERQIIDGAIAYFSEVGFSGQTRELSKRLGITQPLLYRYFSSKQALIERVYQTVFEGRWNPAWVSLMRDRSIPLRERLVEFYRQYSAATYRPDWLRIYLYAGLSGPVLNQRYINHIQRELLPVYCREVRHYCGVESPDLPVAEEEIEFVWSLHGGMFYYAVRQHIYLLPMRVEFMRKVETAIDNFLAGARVTYPRLIASLHGAAAAPAARRRR